MLEMATGGELKEVLVAAEVAAAGAGAAAANATVPLNDRIKFLLASSKVMLFMKGDREEPRQGGYSEQSLNDVESRNEVGPVARAKENAHTMAWGSVSHQEPSPAHLSPRQYKFGAELVSISLLAVAASQYLSRFY